VRGLRDILRINQPWIGKEETDIVLEVLRSGILTERGGMGPKVLEFERNFAKYVGAKHAISMASGTAALHSALLAAGVGNDDEVVVPSFTFPGTAATVVMAGAKPVFADIDEETYCATVESIEAVLSRNTKAIIPVDLYGLPADLAPIHELAQRRGITVVEDAAQAHGAVYNGHRVGSVSEVSCFSFYGAKNMTTGEGGMVTTNEDDIAEQLRLIRSHGESRPYWVSRLGFNYRMTELAAAIGIAQLKKLPMFLERRRKNAQYLSEKLSVVGKIIAPKEPQGREHSWYLYTVRFRGANAGKRNKVVEKLRQKNIDATVFYESPVHTLPFYREIVGARRTQVPETERAARQVFSLPIHPQLETDDLDYMLETLRRVII
jgi:dTDP-4-amino-4,6-dideoxygalactose transaminase